jgi:hypothetical protein
MRHKGIRGAQITYKTGMAEETSCHGKFFANMRTALSATHTKLRYRK